MSDPRILQAGRNCWRIRHADRIALLIDGAAYFRALYHALQQAQQEIFVLSWDIYSDLKLGAHEGDPRALSQLLDDLLQEQDTLRAHILSWDYSVLFAMSREWLPMYKLGWKTHPRLTFQLDNRHPVGASHHQKVVVVDRQLAFCGGLDLTRGRWDTPEHKANDPRRKEVDGTVGRPYHDIQIAVQGEAAGALQDLARERWRRATGESIAKTDESSKPVWPKVLRVDIEDVEVAISRTEPGFEDLQEVREVEQLYLDAIAAAKDYIYIENQFFTCPRISQALVARLQEQDGPQVIINLPLETEGWLAQNSMDVIRVKLLHDLRKAARQQRLAVYYPFKEDAQSMPINLHAKLMIVDDRFIRVGSSNLNNRSMGLDTECDIAIECAPQDARIKAGITDFRDRLLAEHLGINDPKQVGKAITQHGSLLQAIEALRDDNASRTLSPLEDKLPEYTDSVLTDSELIDPELPVNVDELLYHTLPEEDTVRPAKRILIWVISLVLLLGLAAAWRYTALGHWLDIDNVTRTIDTISQSKLGPIVAVCVFILAALLMVPVTLLIIAGVIVFGPVLGFGYAYGSAVTSAMLGYLLGGYLGSDSIKALAGGRINRISQQLARRGVFTIVFVRIVPVAPFTIVNLIAGASHIRMRDFFWGTLLGLLPGVIAIALLTDRFKATLEDPQPETFGILVAVAIAVLGASYLLSRYLMRLREER